MKKIIISFIWLVAFISPGISFGAGNVIQKSPFHKEGKKSFQKDDRTRDLALLNNGFNITAHNFSAPINHSLLNPEGSNFLYAAFFLQISYSSGDHNSCKQYLNHNYPSHNFW